MGGGSSKDTNKSAEEKGVVDSPVAGDAMTAAPVQAFTSATPILAESNPNSFHIVILGPGGVGKSTIVKQVFLHSYCSWKIHNNYVSRHSVSMFLLNSLPSREPKLAMSMGNGIDKEQRLEAAMNLRLGIVNKTIHTTERAMEGIEVVH